MRIAILDKELCCPAKCGLVCIKACPRNRAGDKCITLEQKAVIDEAICIGCGICTKKCPKGAIKIVNTPEQLKESPIHRFGQNGFVLFRLPFPMKGEVVGLLGQNGVGKTTALRILSGEIKPNLGGVKEQEPGELIKIFRGTELQAYLSDLAKVKTVVKPQQIDMLSRVKGTVTEILERYDEKGNKEIIKKLELGACLDRELSKLSGGELQRTAIAIAAERKADFYFFDEPSSYLDVYQRLNTAKLIQELAKESAVLVVEHDLATLDFLADRIHIFYGVPGCYGVVSKPYSARVGINTFLDGYIKEDNVRIREPIKFAFTHIPQIAKKQIYLEWTDLKKGFNGFGLKINSGSVYKGEVLGIFGANALGKTTFAKILAGEVEPDSGEITKKVKISYKPQYISSDFKGSVLELLQTVASDPHAENYKTGILRPLQLEPLLEHSISSLSGGELQRVAIAICLSKETELYLLDEPSAYLDCEQRLAVAKIIRKTCEKQDCSMMVIDHDILFLSYLADRAMLFSGQPSVSGIAAQFNLQEGFNRFLKDVGITFRRDETTSRPRANKLGSVKDREQKEKGTYFQV